MNEQEFIHNLEILGIKIEENKLFKFKRYYQLLREWNNKFNLTSIVEEKDVYLKHFYDSISIFRFNIKDNLNICDFGTGAGFPGVPIAIVNETLNITLVESNSKKILFLNELKKELGLSNITIINSRIEDFSKNNIEKFDIVTCRAVSNINIILEICSQLVKINGYFLPLKSNKDELKDLNIAAKRYGFIYERDITYLLPVENANRIIPVIKKIKSTSNIYPRNYNVILKENKRTSQINSKNNL